MSQSAIECMALVESAIEDLKESKSKGTCYFAVDPEEETLLKIEAKNGDPEQMNIGGFLYRAEFDDKGDYSVTLVV